MLEPRRLAARMAAERLAAELGEAVGERVGYSVRLERRCSARTRLEVVTGGLFLRRLQSDPALEGVGCVVFDEFHERGAEADLALALVRQARALLRPDLRLLLMSATLDLEPLAARLDGAAVLSSAGRSFPVAVRHQPPRERERLEQQVVRALESDWLEERGPGETALVFLPGQREIAAAAAAIAATAWGEEMECTPLHGQLSLAAQGRAIAPARSPAGKVVLASSIAESSLTIAGVTLVVDSGLSRRNRFDPGSGLDRLVTGAASLASAEQRRGRAGRLGPGRCVRLWSAGEERQRPAFEPPELLVADPLPTVLQLAEWGAGLGEELAWIDPPPAAALAEGQNLLQELGALDGQGRPTAEGKAMAAVGLPPRLAHMLVRARQHGGLDLACDLAVLLAERDPLDGRVVGCDLLLRLDWLRWDPRGDSLAGEQARQGGKRPLSGREAQRRELRRLAAALRRQVGAPAANTGVATTGEPTAPSAAELLSWAYPDRLALARGTGDGRFLMRCGRGAVVHPSDPLAAAGALAIARADGEGAEARVHLAVALAPGELEELAADALEERQEVRWDGAGQRVRSERVLRLGALVLARRPWPEAEAEAVRQALAEGLQQGGLAALPWCERSRRLQQRLALAHRTLGEPWPDRSLERLAADPAAWLGGHLLGIRSLLELRHLDLVEALWGELAWERRQELERLLPEAIAIPSGRRVPIDYGGEEPRLAVKLQEMFGCRNHPSVLEGRWAITVELLSPAGRPVALSRDLPAFWRQGYGEVRRELRGRYPKHPWPEDPAQAEATALTKAALARRAAGEGARDS